MYFLTSVLYILLASISVLVLAANDLKFQLDEAAAQKGYFLFSTILPLTEPTVDDSTLVGLARDAIVELKDGQAWKNAITLFKQQNPNIGTPKVGDSPTVVTAMLDSNRIYISSSLKTPGATTPFRMVLRGSKTVNGFLDATCQRCSVALEHPVTDDGTIVDTHHNKAGCGEVMLLHQWDLANDGQLSIGEALQGRKIVAVAGRLGKTAIKAPCRSTLPGGYGCEQVLEGAGLVALDGSTVIPDTTRDVRFAAPMQKSVLC